MTEFKYKDAMLSCSSSVSVVIFTNFFYTQDLLKDMENLFNNLILHQLTLVSYVFILALYINSIIISNQIKYCLAINRAKFLQIQYGFYRHALQVQYHLCMMACYRKSTNQKLKELNSWYLTVRSIMVKGH